MAEVLDRLQIGDLARRHIRDLSGGQQQRVFLARALVAEPDLLVLDEPTSGVDMQTAEKMLHLLLELNRHGMTILMTTHDLNMAAAHVPWIVCLNRRLIAQGQPLEVFTEAILSETYRGDMLVIRHGKMLLVHQKPHWHTLEQAAPNPVPAHTPDNGRAIDALPVAADGQQATEEEEDESAVRALSV
jgi:zinc/manganese transport system ATP-binding protein/zinc transport system ATP-binding protein